MNAKLGMSPPPESHPAVVPAVLFPEETPTSSSPSAPCWSIDSLIANLPSWRGGSSQIHQRSMIRLTYINYWDPEEQGPFIFSDRDSRLPGIVPFPEQSWWTLGLAIGKALVHYHSRLARIMPKSSYQAFFSFFFHIPLPDHTSKDPLFPWQKLILDGIREWAAQR